MRAAEAAEAPPPKNKGGRPRSKDLSAEVGCTRRRQALGTRRRQALGTRWLQLHLLQLHLLQLHLLMGGSNP